MYQYKESGLKNVWLKNGYTRETGPYGRTVSIQDLAGLHQAIATRIVTRSGRLSGAEIRFLRKEMELSQQALGQLLGVSAQSVALWEKSKAKMPAPSDRLYRLLVLAFYEDNIEVRKVIDDLNAQDRDLAEGKFVFQQENKEWTAKAA